MCINSSYLGIPRASSLPIGIGLSGEQYDYDAELASALADFSSPTGVDQEFAATFEKFDCPNSHEVKFTYVFVLTNENGIENTIDFLREIPLVQRSCHIGFSGLHNFDIIALRKSKYALIIDINEQNKLFIQDVLEVLKYSRNRFDFVKNLGALLRYLEEDPILFWKSDSYKDMRYAFHLEATLEREGSWLADDESFQHIRTLAFEGKIVPITENILNYETFENIAKNLKSFDLQIDTLYLTNICQYMRSSQEQFEKSVKSLLEEDTILINCPRRTDSITGQISTNTLRQYACLGRQIETTHLYEIPIQWDKSKKSFQNTQQRESAAETWEKSLDKQNDAPRIEALFRKIKFKFFNPS